MSNRAVQPKSRKFRHLLLGTCLASGLVAAPAAAQDVTVIGTDLGNGKDTGKVNGGTATAAGAADVLGIGVSTGNGADVIENIGLIFVDVDAAAAAILPFSPVGASGLFVNAVGYGLFGDNGPDTLGNTSSITVDVLAAGSITDPGLFILGSPSYVAPSNVNALGVGIEGGNLYDVISNNGDVTVRSAAGLAMIGGTPSIFAGDVGIDLTADARAIGLNGSTEFMTTANNGLLDLTASAAVSLTTLDSNIVNGFQSDTTISVLAGVIGILGDNGEQITETFENTGDIIGAANATATRGSGVVSASDGGVSNAGVNATATYTGIFADGESDTLRNSGLMEFSSNASISSTDIELNIFDVGTGTFDLNSYAEATGMDGGWGDDSLTNTGSILTTATSDIDSFGLNLSLIDLSVIAGRIAALVDAGEDEGPAIQALARGLYGGAGADVLVNDIGGWIDTRAVADTHSVDIAAAAAGVPDSIFVVTLDGDRLASLDTAALAQIIGMDGGISNDALTNNALITGSSSAFAEQIGISVSIPVGFLPDEVGVLPGFTLGGAGAFADASGFGMRGGLGADMLTNSGIVFLSSVSDANALGVSVEIPDFESQDSGVAVDISFTMADVATESFATIAGMAGGESDDAIKNLGGAVSVSADADASATGVGLTGAFEKTGLIVEGVFARATTLADASASALAGEAGADAIENTGFAAAHADANAQSDTFSLIVAGLTSGGAAGISAVEADARAISDAKTLSGGDGADSVVNSGTAVATSIADAGAVGISASAVGVPEAGFAGSETIAITGADATANATALDGGTGDDDLTNTGVAGANATATSATDTIAVSLAGVNTGGAIGFSVMDAASDATANALAVSGGDGADMFFNEGVIGADAIADASAVGVAVDVAIANTGLAGAGSFSRTGATATSTATGVDWASTDRSAENAGSIAADASSTATSTGVSVSLSGASTGLVLGATMLEAGTVATATSSTFDAPDGDNTISNNLTLASAADATANSTGVGVTLGLAISGGATVGFSLADTHSDATANAIGVGTDFGFDQIDNFGRIESIATANANPVSVTVGLSGSMIGAAINVALADASATSTGNASAISTGDLDDTIVSIGDLDATANGLTSSGSVAVEIAGTNVGLSGGAAWAKGDVNGAADARTISAGSGNDTMMLAGTVNAVGNADALASSVSVGLQGSVTGVAIGASLVEAASNADARAAAVDLGAGNDTLGNAATISAATTADASATGVSVNIAATGTGLSVAGSLAETTSNTNATTGAVEGGLGADVIANSGAIDASAIADSRSTNVNVAISGSVSGVSAGVAISDATVGAKATATGIAGDEAEDQDDETQLVDNGGNDDTIMTTAGVTAFADAGAKGTSVSVNVPVAFVPIGVSLTTAASDASAKAFAIDGGYGDDSITAQAAIGSSALADARGASINASLVGGVLGDFDATAGADAFGVFGGDGGDTINVSGLVTSDATAKAGGSVINVTLAGGAVGDLSATANANAYGLGAGAGADSIMASQLVTATANADLNVTNVTAEFAGFTVDDISASANANAFGIDGGAGADLINAKNIVLAAAVSDIDATSVDIILTGAIINDATSTANATSFGLSGASGDDVIDAEMAIGSTATATANDVAVGVNLVGAALADADIGANATATGIGGGGDNDTIIARDAVSATSTATGGGVNVTAQIAGFSSAETKTTIAAETTGVDGGDGHDAIRTEDAVDATSTARINTANVNVNLAGGANNDATSTSRATATGVGGGDGGDTIEINSAVTVLADALADGVGVTVQVAGGADTDLDETAVATAKGVGGGGGDDTIFNGSTVTATADAEADANNVSVQFAGAAFADANVTADAIAIGIAGGDGADAIVNDGAITTLATTTTDSDNVNVALVSGAFSDANTIGNSHAIGIDGGAGDNLIVHTGSIASTARATMEAGNVNVGLAGGSFADIRMTANAKAAGLVSGSGADEVLTELGSTINVLSQITGNANNTNIELIGAAFDNNVIGYDVHSTGVGTGAGGDNIFLNGLTDVDARTSFTLSSAQVTLLGAGFETSRIASDATAIGLDAGAGSDNALVTGRIDVLADTTLSSGGSTRFNLAGFTASDPRFGGVATSLGVDLGSGDDLFMSSNTIKSRAESDGTVGGNSISIVGANAAGGSIGPRANATGLFGGDDNDSILTTALVDVDAVASATLSSIGFTWIGSSSISGAITVGARAIGEDGGAGDDTISNTSTISAYAEANVISSSANATSVGSSSSGSTTVADADAFGMLGGDGDDALFNSGSVFASSRADGFVNRSSYTFAGASSAGSTATATAFSAGMLGGSGDDMIVNSNIVSVNAFAENDARASTTSFVGTSKASSNISADARAVGLGGDSGADNIANFGSLTVVASANPDTTNEANTGGFFIDNRTVSRTSNTTRVIAIDGGSGENTIWNTGNIVARTEGSARSEARSDGDVLDNIFGLDLDAFATSVASNNDQDARGVSAGNEATTFINDGALDISVTGHAYAYANADGDAFASGDGTASATVGVSGGRAYGFVAGDGDNRILNNGTITVLSRPTGNADSISDADGLETFVQPDSRATTSVAVGAARAAGIWLNGGDDIVENYGTISATASPRADEADATASFGGDVLGIDGFATATATANGAKAYGVRAGEGANYVFNAGVINAISSPLADADAVANAVGFDGDATARATAKAEDAVAYGILTGGGTDFIWNDGSITAQSSPTASAFADANPSGSVVNEGEKIQERTSSISGRNAFAIETGDGDDVVVNNGSVLSVIGTSVGGSAISTGDGADVVALLDGSVTRGAISLGDHNDTLLLSGSFTNSSTPNGGAGTDTVIFDGNGLYAGGLTSFEKAAKIGGGIFNQVSLSSMQSLDMASGSLRLLSGYSMSGGGSFKAFVDGDGNFGQLASAAFIGLNGDAKITKGANLFSNGQSFDVVAAPILLGAFDSVALPDATPLLSFEAAQTGSTFTVTANVASMTTVAGAAPEDQAFAAQLDEAASVATGGLEVLLAQMQHAGSDFDFAGAISSFNPAATASFNTETAQSLNQMHAGVRQRLASLRATRGDGAGFVGGTEALRFDQSEQVRLGRKVASGAWRATFGAPLVSSGESAGIVTGVDYLIGGDTLIGASFGSIRSVSPFAASSSYQATVENYVMSLYGSKMIGENGYLDGMVTFGEQESRASNQAIFNDVASLGLVDHGGDSLSFSLEGGRAFKAAGGALEVFGGVGYQGLSDRDLNANVAGIEYEVASRFEQTLQTELGARIGWTAKTEAARIEPRVTVSWRRNLEIGGNDILATFEGAPGYVFRLPNGDFRKDQMMIGAAVDLIGDKAWALSARFEADALDGLRSNAGVLELRLPF